MPRPRQFFEALTEDLFYFNSILIPFAFVRAAMGGSVKAAVMFLCFIPVLFYHYFLRTFLKSFFAFLILTWFSCLLGLFTGHYVINTLFLAFLCSHSVKRRTDMETKLSLCFETIAFPLIFIAVLYVAANYLNMAYIRVFLHFQAVAVLLLSLIYAHLRGINSELELAASNSLQSTKEITDFSNKYLAAYVVGFFAVLALFAYMPFGRIIMFLGGIIVVVLRFVISLINGENVGGGSSGAEFYIREMPMDYEVIQQPLWLRILENTAVYIVNIAVLLLFVFGVAVVFLRMYYGFHRQKKVRITYLNGTSEISAIKPQKRKKKKVFITDPTRRKFYKTVIKYFKRNELSPSDTPREMKERIKDSEDISLLTEQYEKVRYF